MGYEFIEEGEEPVDDRCHLIEFIIYEFEHALPRLFRCGVMCCILEAEVGIEPK